MRSGHSLFYITRHDGDGTGRHHAESTLCIRNVLPAFFLKPRLAATRTAVLFSATLTPSTFYSDTLGLPDDTAHPTVPVWPQVRRMDDAQREAFLARFTRDGRGIGCAVLGGAFSEGVDLVGTRLIGAFIATLGLPQFNPVNEAMRRRLAGTFGAGYDYTYLFPGIRKVVQAAGRVIRTTTDSGTVHLIDDRFARPEVLGLLPSWWRIDDGHQRA